MKIDPKVKEENKIRRAEALKQRNTVLATRLRLALNIRGITKLELANSIGIPATFLSQVLMTKRPMPLSKVKKCSEVLKVNVDYLLGLEDTSENSFVGKDVDTLYSKLLKLRENEIDAITVMIDSILELRGANYGN